MMLADLESKIKYIFKDRSLLIEALTHRSACNEKRGFIKNNERLEFLGDAVVELVITDLLLERFPERNEGKLSKIRASLVNTDSLADLARKIALPGFIILGKGEDASGGRDRDSILADSYDCLLYTSRCV